MGGLERYREMRDFGRTPEPEGRARPGSGFSFVVQKHAASRLHYDFRLELDGVLLSWAVPKGPSLDPSTRRLAMQTEDHPVEYGSFEGVIPKGEYGGGTVMVWDRGHWEPEGDPRKAYRAGKLTFRLHGSKLRGRWHLVRSPGRRGDGDERQRWLLIKGADDHADRDGGDLLVEHAPNSVLSGRDLTRIAADPDRVWHSKEVAGAAGVPDVEDLEGAREMALPRTLEPQLATLVGAPPEGSDWLHEIKLDGYRILARVDHGARRDPVRMLTRGGNDWSDRMPSLVRVLSALPVESLLLDGELVVLSASGTTDFQALQNSLSAGKDEACLYYAFDLLHLDGWDLREVPLIERKETLRGLLAGIGAGEGRIRYGDHVLGRGVEFHQQACEMGLEGIISKRAGDRYRSGRSKSWLKIRCSGRQEFVIGGFTDPGGSRAGFGALLVGTHDDAGRLVYASKVGTGFTQQSLLELHERLVELETDESPFDVPPPRAEARKAHWVAPELVAEIEFTEMTRGGHLRHPSFKGLRGDKPAAAVVTERPAMPARAQLPPGVRITKPDRVLYPESGITKAELVDYYTQVADRMLPHLAARPLTLLRCPEGRQGECFFQQHASPGLPAGLRPIEIEESDGVEIHLVVDDLRGLLGLVQLGSLEIHTWGSRADDVERADILVFDLDPDPGVTWSGLVVGALDVKDQLDELGLESFVKTTGGKGLHVVVPIERDMTWERTKPFTHAVVREVSRRHPGRYVTTMSKAKRKGKIFLDYLRNGRGTTAICPYSTRKHPGAPVATPVEWDELATVRPDHFTVRNLPRRLAALRRDPWQDFTSVKQSVTRAMRRELGMKE